MKKNGPRGGRGLILVVNPGSTSTKIAVFRKERCLAEETLRHPKKKLDAFGSVNRQKDFRLAAIRGFLRKNGYRSDSFAAIAARGGLTRPIAGGTYAVNARMLADLSSGAWGEHPSSLGAPLADELAREAGIPAYIADPPIVDELWDYARISGHPEFERKSIFHALSQKAAARKAARTLGVKYERANFVVAHLGGGISVGAHLRGRVVDVNNALDGEGPFTPERSGTLPAGQLAKFCFSGNATLADVKKMLTGRGGLYAYLGTNDCRKIEERIAKGDKKAELVYGALAYQIAREIGACAAVLSGRVTAVVLTGGMSVSRPFVARIRRYAGFVGPFRVFPQVEEMVALAMAASGVIDGEIKLKEYS